MIFPRTKFVDTNSLIEQRCHLTSEVIEVDKEFDAFPKTDFKAVACELFDVIHSAETALRILEERHGVNILAAKQAVIHKNTARGYYAK